MALLLMIVTMSISLTACGSDDKDEPEDTNYYDYSIVWDVVDNGDYTASEALAIAAQFTAVSEDIIAYCTEARAKELFDEFCQELRYDFATGYYQITLKARLIRNEGKKQIAEKTFYIHPDGTTIKAPALNAEDSSVIIVK